jgi:endonuclease/exonuclease/phosphatase family metal-dependent hydrolase
MPMTDVRRVSYTKEPAIRHQQRGALIARISGVLVIVTHLDEHADASDVRQRQVGELLRAWGEAPVAIIAGDLNAPPGSAEMELLARSGFSDLALQAGADEPTFPADKPEQRIDYVWGVGLTGAQAHTVASTASDHRAVVVNVTRVSGR